MSGEYFECGEHGWSYEPEDSCPVCDGIKLERERILKLLEPLAQHDPEWCGKVGCYPEDCSAPHYEYAIELIKGETNG